MRGIFDQPAEDQLKRSKRIRKIKTFFDETISKKQPVMQKSKTMLSHYVHYHENKKGQLVKTFRCKKCCGFVRLGQKECSKCIVKAAKRSLAKAKQSNSQPTLSMEQQSPSQSNLVAPKEPDSLIIMKKSSLAKQSMPTKSNSGKDTSQVKVAAQNKAPDSKSKSVFKKIKKPSPQPEENIPRKPKSTKPISVKTKDRKNDQQRIYRRRLRARRTIMNVPMNNGSQMTDAERSNPMRFDRSQVAEIEQFAGFAGFAGMETGGESSTSAAGQKLEFFSCLSLEHRPVATRNEDIEEEHHEDENIITDEKNEDSISALLLGPNIEIIQENEENQ